MIIPLIICLVFSAASTAMILNAVVKNKERVIKERNPFSEVK